MDAIESVAIILAAIATVVYAGLTWRMVGEMQRTRQAQERPYVYMDLTRQESTILLVVANSGNGPASNIAFHFDRPIVTWEDKQSQQRIEITATALPLVAKGIPFLPPGREIVTSIGSFIEYFEKAESEERPVNYSGRVTYTNTLTGELYDEGIILDFEHFKDILWLVQRDTDDLVKEVAKVGKEIIKVRRALDSKGTICRSDRGDDMSSGGLLNESHEAQLVSNTVSSEPLQTLRNVFWSCASPPFSIAV